VEEKLKTLNININTGYSLQVLIQLIDPGNIKLLPHSNIYRELSPLYAAGRIYEGNFLDQVVIQTFFNHFTSELLVELINYDHGTSHNLGTTNLYLKPIPDGLKGKEYGVAFSIAIQKYEWLLLGIYRAEGNLDAILPYVYTNPPPRTLLLTGDQLYVLEHIHKT